MDAHQNANNRTRKTILQAENWWWGAGRGGGTRTHKTGSSKPSAPYWQSVAFLRA